MISYCVRQKKQTKCVDGSERLVTTKNGRTMMKCKCAECGITKTQFVSEADRFLVSSKGESKVLKDLYSDDRFEKLTKSGRSRKSAVVGSRKSMDPKSYKHNVDDLTEEKVEKIMNDFFESPNPQKMKKAEQFAKSLANSPDGTEKKLGPFIIRKLKDSDLEKTSEYLYGAFYWYRMGGPGDTPMKMHFKVFAGYPELVDFIYQYEMGMWVFFWDSPTLINQALSSIEGIRKRAKNYEADEAEKLLSQATIDASMLRSRSDDLDKEYQKLMREAMKPTKKQLRDYEEFIEMPMTAREKRWEKLRRKDEILSLGRRLHARDLKRRKEANKRFANLMVDAGYLDPNWRGNSSARLKGRAY